MRKEFGRFMCEIAERDDRILLIVGDIGYQTFDEYREKFSDRFLNIGICEQSMIGISSGMALEGLKPWVYTITPFLIERPFEQIKLDIDEQNVNVKLVGYADYPKQGPTHRALNEAGLMGLLKNTRSYFPKSSEEARKMFYHAYESFGPMFISLKNDISKEVR